MGSGTYKMNFTKKVFIMACIALVINFLVTRLPCVYNSICSPSDMPPLWYCCISPFLFLAMMFGFCYGLGNLGDLFKGDK